MTFTQILVGVLTTTIAVPITVLITNIIQWHLNNPKIKGYFINIGPDGNQSLLDPYFSIRRYKLNKLLYKGSHKPSSAIIPETFDKKTMDRIKKDLEHGYYLFQYGFSTLYIPKKYIGKKYKLPIRIKKMIGKNVD